MIRERWSAVLVLTAVVLAALIAGWVAQGVSELDREARLAQVAGVALEAEAYAPPERQVRPADNAATHYRALVRPLRKHLPFDLRRELLSEDSTVNRSHANALLAVHATYFAELERALALPDCEFDRDWSLGNDVLFPEYARIQDGVDLYLLRGTLAVRRGKVSAALADVRRAAGIGDHCAQGDGLMGFGQARQVQGKILETVGTWLLENPNSAPLREFLAGYPLELAFDPQPAFASEFYVVWHMLDQARSPVWRSSGRLRPLPVAPNEGAMPGIFEGRARSALIRSYRRMSDALGLPVAQGRRQFELGRQGFMRALGNFPTAKMYLTGGPFGESGPNYDGWRTYAFESQAMPLKRDAILQAITPTGPVIDLPETPNLGSAVHYRTDGRSLSLHFSSDDGLQSSPLQIPPPPSRAWR